MIGNPLLLPDEGYNISRSVRLRSSASAYFNRTPASSGNRTTWTWSGWVKRGALGSLQFFFSANTNSGSDTDHTDIRFSSSDTLQFVNDASGLVTVNLNTTQVFRDPSAWYHIVVAVDTTQATASNRIKFYVNGSQITAFGTATYPSQNASLFVNNNINHRLGGYQPVSGPFDGYLTEINFVDGQALTPSSFGETDAVTGVWKPKKYTGTYGTNGFFLNFSDNSNNTAATIGKDYSGNGNNWTPNNISVTSGTTYDSMLDVPTLWADGGNGRGNYAVMNPLQTGSYVTQSNGNLTNTGNTATNSALVLASIGQLTSGKWYWEYTQGTVQSETCGVCTQDMSGVSLLNGENIGAYGVGVRASGTVYGGTVGSITSWTAGDVIGIAVDCDNGAAYWSKNGTWLNSGVPTSGSSKTGAVGTWTPSPTKLITPAFGAYNGGSVSATFGQRPFSYTPPSGFKALNTLNLPDATIKKGNQYFNTVLYTGNGSSQAVSGVGFQPDLVWVKNRSTNVYHTVSDSVRGALQLLQTQSTAAEVSGSHLSSFDSDGFSVLTATAVNGSGNSLVAWNWKEGATQGFDIVTFTGTGAAQNISHSLGVAPKMIVCKRRNSTGEWLTYTQMTGNTSFLELNTTAASFASSTAWNNTSPTSSVFTVGTASGCNASGGTYVAYLFSEVAGFSRFGSYTGNGSADGPFVFCGFRPRWVMIKRTNDISNWNIFDTARNTANVNNNFLAANLSNAESQIDLDIVSNGFKPRDAGGTATNANGSTYIFAAFAESPFKNSLAR